MPFIEIFNLSEASSTAIEYVDEHELLESIIGKYNANMNIYNARLSIGRDIFLDWHIPIGTCLHYGRVIKIYSFLIKIFVEYENQTPILIEIDSRKSILKLKYEIRKRLGLKVSDQILTFEDKTIDDNMESLIYHKLRHNSHVRVRKRDVHREATGHKKKINIHFCGQPSDSIIDLTNQDDVFTMREKLCDVGIDPDKHVIRFKDQMHNRPKLTHQGKQYPRLVLDHLDNIDLYPMEPQEKDVHEVTRRPSISEWNIDVPVWRLTTPGLCLQGVCKNLQCVACEQMVVVNLGAPFILKLNSLNKPFICCPMCKQSVRPELIGVNNTEWRYISSIETPDRPCCVKSDWNIVGNILHQLNNLDKNLVIETRTRSDSLTREFKCAKCLSAHPQIKENGNGEICRHEFYDKYKEPIVGVF